VNFESLEHQVSGLAVLDQPLTRRAYELVVERGELGRDAAAEALGVARSVAAFHLDKLVDAGLLATRYQRLSGRTGPGAGRPAKLYARSSREVALSIPPRRYDLAGAVLAEAIGRTEVQGAPLTRAVRDVAREAGRDLGARCAAAHPDDSDRNVLLRALERQGYEPRDQDGEITLLNFPFHALAERQRSLICGMNLDLLTGMVDGVGETDADSVSARLAPEPGYCCVRLAAR
jgi:predicted ArsR family transcriptional regulator